jgi:serine/threonine protein kinase
MSDKDTLEIKVVDFGIAGYIRNNIGETTDFGTVRYMAPEVLSKKDLKASRAMDIWACGIILYSMLFNKFPFSGKSKGKIVIRFHQCKITLNSPKP